jgi:hypothetical protein
MIKARSLLVASLLLALPVTLSAQYQAWRTDGGRIVLHFDDSVLEEAGLALTDVVETTEPGDSMSELMEEPMMAFIVDPSSDMLFLSGHNGAFMPYGILGGGVRAFGGFTLTSVTNGHSVDFTDFVVHAEPVRNDGPGGQPDPDYFFLSTADELMGDFKLCYVKIAFDAEFNPYGGTGGDHVGPVVQVKAWDLIVTERLAGKLGRPDLLGMTLGEGKVHASAGEYHGDWSYPKGQNPWTPYTGGETSDAAGGDGGDFLDVSLGILSSITQLGHDGTFPNGRAGLSTATTSCNLGNVNVPWLAPMQENHPGIHQALYRQMGDRFEQVGIAWIKHGFFALSNSQCIPCQQPSPGTFLGVGCSDTYGTSNNGNRVYLGPRDEWHAYDNDWTCMGSFFDGTPVDCIRDQGGSGFGAVDHRLEAYDFDLDLPGAEYFYEAMYLVIGDEDIHNNVGSRECTMNWNGFSWQFATPSALSGNPLIEGPAIERYGEVRTIAGIEPDDGNVILAVQTRDLGGGQWRYEYALFNWNLERRVGSFSVPASANPTDFYFHDIDVRPENNWVPIVDEGNLTFVFPEVFLGGHKVGGPLEWGYLYNFGFTSTQPPVERNAVLGIYDAGIGGDLLGAATLAPSGLNLSSSKMSPEVGELFNIVVKGGTNEAMIAVTESGGVPLPSPLIIGPAPFVGGEVSIPIVVPPVAAGVSFKMTAGEVTVTPLTLLGLTNSMTIAVQ